MKEKWPNLICFAPKKVSSMPMLLLKGTNSGTIRHYQGPQTDRNGPPPDHSSPLPSHNTLSIIATNHTNESPAFQTTLSAQQSQSQLQQTNCHLFLCRIDIIESVPQTALKQKFNLSSTDSKRHPFLKAVHDYHPHQIRHHFVLF